jgi:hypothetical protein
MTDAHRYVDLVVELRDLNLHTDTFEVQLLPSALVGDPQPVRVPHRLADMQDALDDLERKRITADRLVGLGRALADRLLPEGVRDPFQRVLGQAGQEGRVRLRLMIRNPKLAQIPWEYAHLEGTDAAPSGFVLHNPQVSMVRHEALPTEYPSLQGRTPDHLRMLAAMASPSGYARLQLGREKGVLQDALRDFDVEGVTIEWELLPEEVTEEALTGALIKGADIFHFAGHGDFHEEDFDEQTGDIMGTGRIVLAPSVPGGAARLLRATDLAPLLQQAGVRLAVFGACDSGRRDGVSAWTGVAPALIGRGIPAVVAMQYEILDYQATEFMRGFYTAMASGLSLDEAVAMGRLAMVRKNQADSDWGVPVLYMRSADGVIFSALAERQKELAAGLRTAIDQDVETVRGKGRVTGAELADSKALSELGGLAIKQKIGTVEEEAVVTGLRIGSAGDERRRRRKE